MRLCNVSSKVIAFALLFSFVCVTILRFNSNRRVDTKIIRWKTDKLIDNERIFFHETSGRNELSLRQSCAVESAALHNPNRPVQVFFQPEERQQSTSSPWFQVLNHYENIMAIVIDDEKVYFKDTPLNDWYVKGQWRNSRFRMEHMSDYIRMVSLFKEGGMFIDLDIVTIKSYDDRRIFRNFTQTESSLKDQLTNAVFQLSKGHRLIGAIIDLLVEEYDPDEYIFHGPQVVSLAVSRICNLSFNNSNSSCPDLRILNHRYFYPIGNAFWGQFFFENDEAEKRRILKRIRSGYGFHTWNNLSKNTPIDTSEDSTQVYAILAAEHCPFTWKLRKQFSINWNWVNKIDKNKCVFYLIVAKGGRKLLKDNRKLSATSSRFAFLKQVFFYQLISSWQCRNFVSVFRICIQSKCRNSRK